MKQSILLLFLAFFLFSCSTQKEEDQAISTTSVKENTIKQVNNPIIKEKYTADPAAIVHGDSVFLYAGHDEAENDFFFYKMNEWLVYSSADLVNWKSHAVPLKVADFEWASADAWAGQVIQRNGKFYWYVTVSHATVQGKAIGVAVSDSPIGPFKDVLGKALVTNNMTKKVEIDWDDIDPTVFIDDDNQAYLFWGNSACYYAKLKENMIEFDGEIKTIDLPNYTEAPWIHKQGDWYYLSYAYQFPEKTAYAMSKSITGPWEYKGILNELAGNCNTNHQAILDFKGQSYYIYHNGGIQPNGGSFRRSVCIDELHYNTDGTMQRIIMTSEGIQ